MVTFAGRRQTRASDDGGPATTACRRPFGRWGGRTAQGAAPADTRSEAGPPIIAGSGEATGPTVVPGSDSDNRATECLRCQWKRRDQGWIADACAEGRARGWPDVSQHRVGGIRRPAARAKAGPRGPSRPPDGRRGVTKHDSDHSLEPIRVGSLLGTDPSRVLHAGRPGAPRSGWACEGGIDSETGPGAAPPGDRAGSAQRPRRHRRLPPQRPPGGAAAVPRRRAAGARGGRGSAGPARGLPALRGQALLWALWP